MFRFDFDFWMKVLGVPRGEGLRVLCAEDLPGAEPRAPPLAHVRSLRHRGPPQRIQGQEEDEKTVNSELVRLWPD